VRAGERGGALAGTPRYVSILAISAGPSMAAIEGHATTLYSEDMQHGLTLDGMKVANPFR